jgi:RNA ligase (TIGR02306 family)
MTEIKAKVVKFTLEKHPNADTLSIAKIDGTGWQSIVKTEDMINAELGVYIPIDSEVDTKRAEFKHLDKNNTGARSRIKTIKLRGVLSQGMLIAAPVDYQLGDDLTEFYDVKRYEPPIPTYLAGDTIRCPEAFSKYTSIDNAKNIKNPFQQNELVRVTEKIHGTNFRAGFVFDGTIENNVPKLKYFVGSHNTAKSPDGQNEYSVIALKYNLAEKIENLLKKYNPTYNFIIFGEIFGKKIQHLDYNCEKNERKLSIFDVLIDGKYQNWDVLCEIAQELGLDVVPLLYKGPYDHEIVMQHRDGLTTLGGKHIREGVVVTPLTERFDSVIGRVILKYISDDYLLNQGKKGSTDGH